MDVKDVKYRARYVTFAYTIRSIL